MRKEQYISRQISCHTMVTSPVLTTDVNGLTIAYQDQGSGSPLVLINGFASTMDMWSPPVLAALASRFRIIIFDHRGTGYSSASDDPVSMTLLADDTQALMDALGISRAHLLGHSMGASVAQELVLAHPERVDRLILVAGTCGGSEAVRMAPEVWETLSDKRGTGLDIASHMFQLLFTKEWLAAHDPWKYCPEVRETISAGSAARQATAFYTWPGSYDRLSQIRLPTLIVTGMDDVIIPPANAVTLAGRIPGARLAQFPGAGHGLLYQCPEEFTKVVLEFLGVLS